MAVCAYVLVEAGPGKARDALRKICGLKGIKSAHCVTGPYDIVAFAEAEDLKELGELVVAKIQKVTGVVRTLTCPVVEL